MGPVAHYHSPFPSQYPSYMSQWLSSLPLSSISLPDPLLRYGDFHGYIAAYRSTLFSLYTVGNPLCTGVLRVSISKSEIPEIHFASHISCPCCTGLPLLSWCLSPSPKSGVHNVSGISCPCHVQFCNCYWPDRGLSMLPTISLKFLEIRTAFDISRPRHLQSATSWFDFSLVLVLHKVSRHNQLIVP